MAVSGAGPAAQGAGGGKAAHFPRLTSLRVLSSSDLREPGPPSLPDTLQGMFLSAC